VLASNSVSVTFGDCAKDVTIGNLTGFQNLLGLSPWELTRPTASSHSIAILSDAVKGFEEGSIIGAFDINGNCFGITQLERDGNCLTIFADDELTAEKDGFVAAEQIFFKLYKPSTEEEFELIPEFDLTLPNATGLFEENGLSAISRFKVGNTGIPGFDGANIQVYPNPSTGRFNVRGISSNANVQILDMQGQLIEEFETLFDKQYSIDLSDKNAGVYMMIIKQNMQTTYHKLTLK
jgi:hypothetical protein